MTPHRRTAIRLVLAIAAFTAVAVAASAQGVQGVSASLANERSMPVLGQPTLPVYPAGNAGGMVDIEVVVDVNGTVAHTRVATSSDSTGALDRACLAAMKGWQVTPATTGNGRPLSTLALARFTFNAPRAAADTGTVSVSLLALPESPPPGLDAIDPTTLRDAKVVRVRFPLPLRRINPHYTAAAMRAKVQGSVQLEIVVLADGTVGAGRVTKSLEESLDEQALAAARYWFFEPAQVDGQPVATKAILQLDFNLK